jgi:hypothetical protein
MVAAGQKLPFDVLLATPQTVAYFRPHGRILGPKDLMPNEKKGTIVSDFASYGVTPEEKGLILKPERDPTPPNGTHIRVVVGKVAPPSPAP